MIVRPVGRDEAEAAGRVVVAAFEAVPGGHMGGGYAVELADVEGRAEVSEVLIAVNGPEVVGCVTFVPDDRSPLAEQLEDGECQIRMMAVAPSCQGRGVGQLLLEAVLDRARVLRRRAVFLHSTPVMRAAHALYERNGFVRSPERDWLPEPNLLLIAFRLDLGLPQSTDPDPDPGRESGESGESGESAESAESASGLAPAETPKASGDTHG
jgi:ribosomal protein S18 acetylase RimI-like enzyme